MSDENLGAYMHPCEACNGTGTEKFEYGIRHCSRCEGIGIEPEPDPEDEESDEETIIAALQKRRLEKCRITFLDGDTYVTYVGSLLEVYAKAHELDEIARDEKRLGWD